MKKVLLLLVGLLTLSLASAQTLVFGQSGLPVTLDSAQAQDGNSLSVAYQITEPLVSFKPGTAELVPGLATEWEGNEDASVWTFTLREGVEFHDGTPFNAEAVKFNYDRWNDRENEYSFADEGVDYTSFTYVFSGYLGDGSILEEVNVIDEYTVEFVLTDSVGFFPAMVAASYFGLDSPQAVMEAGADYGTPGVGSVGTGPYMFTEWTEGERVLLTRFENYWQGMPNAEEVVFRGISDPTARLAELQAGSIDIAIELNPDDLSVIQGDENLTAVEQQGLNVGYFGFHQGNEPLDDLRVRQAIAHAVDWDAIVDAFFGGLGVRATEFYPDAFFGRAGVPPYEYDPERARELLAEAGYADGFDTEIWYMPVSRPYFPSPEPIAATVATYLADVGINAELQTEDWGVYLENYYTGKYPIYMLGWSPDYPDPDNYVNTFFGPGQTGQAGFGWENQEVLDNLFAARTSPDQDERISLYEQVNQAIYDEIPAIPVAHNNPLHATRTNIDNFLPSPFSSPVALWLVTKAE